jgi:glycerol-3-phosphate dehydrogenase
VVTVTGGKLTTYREMAEDTVDTMVRHLDGAPRRARRSRTARLRQRGADGPTPVAARHLVDRYGSEAGAIQALLDEDPSLGEPLVEGLPYLRAEAVHAVRHEMATTVDDVLSRRTRARLQARDASAAAAPAVADLLASELGWSAGEAAAQAAAYAALVAAERAAPGLPLTGVSLAVRP